MWGCIGTDFVDEPLAPSASHAEIIESEVSLQPTEEYTLSFRLVAVDGSELPAVWEWASRNENVAMVSNDGTVVGIGTGQTWVDATANAEFADSCLVTVVSDPDAVASITIEGDTTNMDVDETRQLTAVLRNIDGDEISGDVTWESNNTAVATVDASGLVTAIANGDVGIVASSSGKSSVPFEITVGESVSSRMGMFSGRNGYNAEGTAVLETVGSNSTLILKEDFKTQNGPGLYIYLSKSDQNVSGGIELSMLDSTEGMQSFDIAGGVDVSQFNYAIIYCKPFGIVFAAALLE